MLCAFLFCLCSVANAEYIKKSKFGKKVYAKLRGAYAEIEEEENSQRRRRNFGECAYKPKRRVQKKL